MWSSSTPTDDPVSVRQRYASLGYCEHGVHETSTCDDCLIAATEEAKQAKKQREEHIEQRIIWYLESPSHASGGPLLTSQLRLWLLHDFSFKDKWLTQREFVKALNQLLAKGLITFDTTFVIDTWFRSPLYPYSEGAIVTRIKIKK